ncbi:glycosyltransferase [Flavobacterium pedocola]
MKLLFITPTVANFGGVPKIALTRADYCARVWGDEVHFISQNEAGRKPFFDVDTSITFHNIQLGKKDFRFFSNYIQQVQALTDSIQPDIILVFDNGLKAFLLPFFLKTTAKTVFECHSALDVQERSNSSWFELIGSPLYKFFKRKAVKRYDLFLTLSEASAREWKVKKNYVIVPNFVQNTSGKISSLTNKTVLVVARNAYEKGFDRLLDIWEAVCGQNQDWKLQLITNEDGFFDLKKAITERKLINVEVIPPQQNIDEFYSEASVYLMTSRYEGFPLVLLEAMAFGLAVIAYNCPIGPGEIIRNNENGLLAANDNQAEFVSKLNLLLQDFSQREMFQQNAIATASQYLLEKMMDAFNSQVRSS